MLLDLRCVADDDVRHLQINFKSFQLFICILSKFDADGIHFANEIWKWIKVYNMQISSVEPNKFSVLIFDAFESDEAQEFFRQKNFNSKKLLLKILIQFFCLQFSYDAIIAF